MVLVVKIEVKRHLVPQPVFQIGMQTQNRTNTPLHHKYIYIHTRDRPHRVTEADTFHTRTNTNSSNDLILLPSLAEQDEDTHTYVCKYNLILPAAGFTPDLSLPSC